MIKEMFTDLAKFHAWRHLWLSHWWTDVATWLGTPRRWRNIRADRRREEEIFNDRGIARDLRARPIVDTRDLPF